MSAYSRGAARERQLQARLQAQGWIVQRSAGSKGCCDLCAMRDGRIRLIEVKTDPRPFDNFPPAKREQMKADAELAGAVAELCHWPARAQPRWLPADCWP